MGFDYDKFTKEVRFKPESLPKDYSNLPDVDLKNITSVGLAEKLKSQKGAGSESYLSKLKNNKTLGKGLGLFDRGLGAFGAVASSVEAYESFKNKEYIDAAGKGLAAVSYGANAIGKFKPGVGVGATITSALKAKDEFKKGEYYKGAVSSLETLLYGASALSKKVPGAFVVASGLGLAKDIANAENFQLASNWSDVLFGKAEQGGGIGDLVGTALNAAFAPGGVHVATAKIGYRVGNVIGEKTGITERVAKALARENLIDLKESESPIRKRLTERRENQLIGIEERNNDLTAAKYDEERKAFNDRLLKIRSKTEAPDFVDIKELEKNDRVAAFRKQYITESYELNEKSTKKDREEAMRRGVPLEEVVKEREDRKGYVNESKGFVPNFSFAREKMSIMSSPDYAGYRNAVPNYSKHYSNVVKNSAEIEVPATEVYNRMGFFGATPKNPSEQYAILNPAQQKSLGYAQGFVPNFAANDFIEKMSESIKGAISEAFGEVMPQGNSTSNVVHINDNSTYHGASQVNAIKKFLMDQFPKELGKYGPDFLTS